MPVFYILVTPHQNHYQWFDDSTSDPNLLQGSFADLCDHLNQGPENRQLVAILPMECAMMVQVDVPKAQRRYLNQALPYLVEPLVAEDIDNLHCVAMPGQDRQSLNVMVCQHHHIAPLIDGLKSQQWKLAEFVVDADLQQIPYVTDGVISWCEERIVVSLPGLAFVCTRDTLGVWLEFALKQIDTSNWQIQLNVYDQAPAAAATLAAEMAQYGFAKVHLSHHQGGQCARIHGAWSKRLRQPRSLLQGRYSQQKSWQRWQWLAVPSMAAALLMLSAVMLWYVSTMRDLEHMTARSWAEMEAQVAAVSAGQVQLDRGRWRQQVEQYFGADSTAPTESNAIFIQLMLAVDQALTTDIELHELRYLSEQGAMHLVVMADSTASLEAFRQALLAANVMATYSAARTTSSVRGQFRLLSAAGAS